MNRVLSRLVFTFLLAVLAAACSTSTHFEASTERATNAPVFAPTDSSSIQFLPGPSSPQYVVLGDIRLRLKGVRSVPDIDTLSDPAIQQELRSRAAALGANAIVDVMVLHRAGDSGSSDFGSSSAIPVEVRATAIRNGS